MFKLLWIGSVFVAICSGQVGGGNACPVGIPNSFFCFQFGSGGIPKGWTPVGGVHSGPGQLNIANGQLSSDSHFEPFCDDLIFRANIRGAKNQHLGLAANLQAGPFILFSTDDSTGQLFARVRTEDGKEVKQSLNGNADPHHRTNGYLGGGTTFQIQQSETQQNGHIVPLIIFAIKVDGGPGFIEVTQRVTKKILTPMRISFFDGGFLTADGQRRGIDLSSVDHDCVPREPQPPHSRESKVKR
jgi:hypothetical protein